MTMTQVLQDMVSSRAGAPGLTPDNLDRHFWLPSNPAIKECISNL